MTIKISISTDADQHSSDIQQVTFDSLLKDQTSAAVILDSQYDVVYFHGDTGDFLLMPSGKPNFNILKIAREGLKKEIRTLIIEATANQHTVIYDKQVQLQNQDYVTKLELTRLNETTENHYLLVFRKLTVSNEVISNEALPSLNDDLKTSLEKLQSNQEKEEKVAKRTYNLQESPAFLKSILNTTQNLIYIYDLDKEKIIFINGNSHSATGYTPDEIISAEKDIFSPLIHNDDLKNVMAQRQLIRISPDNEMAAVEFRLKNKSGWSCQLSRDMVFKRDNTGRAIQYIGVCTDISDLKDVNAQLEAKNSELKRSNVELASFSSIASHDLKEPLRKIMIFSKLVLSREKGNVSEESRGFMDRVIVSAHRMQQLIDDLISYSRSSAKAKIKFTPSDLNVLIEEALEDLDEVIAEENAAIDISELPVLAVYPSQFRQLFLNLISNAIKYRKPNIPPAIRIYAEKATLEEIASLDGDQKQEYCKIVVQDNGIGFSEEFKEKIFEPFQRLHDKDEYSGTGIGLAICRKILLNHDGFLLAQSSPGTGATFTIFVPWIN